MNDEKFKSFIKEIESNGYEIKNELVNKDIFNNEIVISKDNFYYVKVDRITILEAPKGYLLDYIKEEFKRLENEYTKQY